MTLTRQVQDAQNVEGVNLRELSPGTLLLVRTKNSSYFITYLGYGAARVEGNPRIWQGSQLVNILGATWGGSALRIGFIGIGMCLQFQRPGDARIVTTTAVQSILRLRRAQPKVENLPATP